jgi:hypothetical protein
VLAYVTGKKNVQIPWEQLKQDPSKWIKVSCYPKHFIWKDPSKIRVEDTFKLLGHWRRRISQGKNPLIWITTCDLFKKVTGVVRHGRAIRPEHPVEQQESSEENYDLDCSGASGDEDEQDEGNAEGSNSATDADADTGEQSDEDEDSDAVSEDDAEEDGSDGTNASESPADPASDTPVESENQRLDSGSSGHPSQHPGEYCI